ncbi:restriction endonuclease [Zhouia spongiae]|uniref:Restriction endonuclease n=1 Tax=Zhouia spongiae TaxID=2202721 RepID=A0ABY3YLL3_9FLAO|nr:restriction endonuclease [Zhouia spongiae]UNY98729.1 restriction endonuclease [Zhouia spongiae]
MEKEKSFKVLKRSGEEVGFSFDKLRASLRHTGAEHELISTIVDTVSDELYAGITTEEIYNRAYAMLKKNRSVYASKYKLKKAIYELGPTGFPFEKFIGNILKYSGYECTIGAIVEGACVDHEVDVLAYKNNSVYMVECKFHSDPSNKCDVKIPLYINSRYKDIQRKWNSNNTKRLKEGWVVTNTRFTKDAIQYGECAGLYLMSWDYPAANSLKERINRLGLHPVTCSTLLSRREKDFLLEHGIVLCRDLITQEFMLDHMGVSDERKDRIISDMKQLCN